MPADGRALRALLPLLLVSLVVVMVTVGLAQGLWLANLHNALLALAFTCVGAYVLFQRPGHLSGALFMATGTVEAVMFLGRQLGHFSDVDTSPWWGWVGVWPVALALGLFTLSVIFFPDGRLPSRHWAPVVAAVIVVTAVCATVSALWPVEYVSAGISTPHPLTTGTPRIVADGWSVIAHPVYALLQVLWVVVVVARWRVSDGHVRSQLIWLIVAATISAVALALGLAVWGTPTIGLLSAALVPMAAGWAIVHGQHLVTYSALSWLSRSGPDPHDLPHELARAAATALNAPRATLWMGDSARLDAIGVWPETTDPIEPSNLGSLQLPVDVQVRAVTHGEKVVGALSVQLVAATRLSLAEGRILDDLAAQAALVLDRQNLAELIATGQRAGRLEGLTPREQEVLDLMARGLSNAAICEELHLSIKTVEPVVSTIFAKLQLHPDADSNRRVLAVLAYLRS